MRVAPHRRRRWNNILILAVVLFIGVLNLPTVIKTYFMQPPVATQYPTLLNPNWQLQAMHFSHLSLEKNQGRWRATPPSEIAPETLVERWKLLVGTEVDDATYQSFQSMLRSPQTVEVWYSDREEPQRITFYQTPRFWLFKNWQDKWIAISVEKGYLLPE
ncbi:hypothetical protein [Vibrio ziniensis]|uniref:50S ribosomal protein L33 n=1 Tax=Vibrio ziniensis TaxID=2711221 RepID=A0A6G7CLK2_9VIBR|nr:hypothetical protein [Vibrio ziniensis]QIH43011.1 hypothetical protein G5S32_14125 [Vibrio ziniensis]